MPRKVNKVTPVTEVKGTKYTSGDLVLVVTNGSHSEAWHAVLAAATEKVLVAA